MHRGSTSPLRKTPSRVALAKHPSPDLLQCLRTLQRRSLRPATSWLWIKNGGCEIMQLMRQGAMGDGWEGQEHDKIELQIDTQHGFWNNERSVRTCRFGTILDPHGMENGLGWISAWVSRFRQPRGILNPNCTLPLRKPLTGYWADIPLASCS